MGTNKVMLGNTTLLDLTTDSFTDASQLCDGISAHTRNGDKVYGTALAVGKPTIKMMYNREHEFKTWEDFLCHLELNPAGTMKSLNVSAYCQCGFQVINPTTFQLWFYSLSNLPTDPIYYNNINEISQASTIMVYAQWQSGLTTNYTFSIDTSNLISAVRENNVVTGVRVSPFNINWGYISTPDGSQLVSVSAVGSLNLCLTDAQPTVFTVPINLSSVLTFDVVAGASGKAKFQVTLDSDTPLVIETESTYVYTYGIDIIDIIHIANDAIFLIYNFQTSATARSTTRSCVIYIRQDGALGKTANRIIFAASAAYWGTGANGSVYSGKLFPLDFKEGAEWKIGMQYIRNQITSANANTGRWTYMGILNFYASTTASRIMMQAVSTSFVWATSANVASCNPTTGADVGFMSADGNVWNPYLKSANDVYTWKTYLARTSGTNVSATAASVSSDNTSDDSAKFYTPGNKILGRLEDGNYVVYRETGSSTKYIDIWTCKFTTSTNNSKWELVISLSLTATASLTSDDVILLKNNVLLADDVLYCISYNTDYSIVRYYLKKLGTYTKSVAEIRNVTNIDSSGFTAKLIKEYPYVSPTGQYSNLFKGIGDGAIYKS